PRDDDITLVLGRYAENRRRLPRNTAAVLALQGLQQLIDPLLNLIEHGAAPHRLEGSPGKIRLEQPQRRHDGDVADLPQRVLTQCRFEERIGLVPVAREQALIKLLPGLERRLIPEQHFEKL